MKNQPSSEMLYAPTIFSSDNRPPTSILLQNPHSLVDPLAVFLDYVDGWDGHSDATYACGQTSLL